MVIFISCPFCDICEGHRRSDSTNWICKRQSRSNSNRTINSSLNEIFINVTRLFFEGLVCTYCLIVILLSSLNYITTDIKH